jgi:hypothetical protein
LTRNLFNQIPKFDFLSLGIFFSGSNNIKRRKMKSVQRVGAVLLVGGVLLFASQARAAIMINEFLADPANGLAGDANRDGVRSSGDDEFIELLNNAFDNVDISGWKIADSASVRHVFPVGSVIDAYSYLVVFGAGDVAMFSNAQKASTGGLALNNTSDRVKLFNADLTLIDEVIYGSEANLDRSLIRAPEGEKNLFALHSSLENAQGSFFSPGMRADGHLVWKEKPVDSAVVPEFPTVLYLALALPAFLHKRFVVDSKEIDFS